MLQWNLSITRSHSLVVVKLKVEGEKELILIETERLVPS